MGSIKITLRSDLCVGNGQGLGSTMDTDVCYDDYGLPYIPARRLKGCLREAAVYIKMQDIDALFGTTGSSESGCLKLSNAYPEGYREVLPYLKKSPSRIGQSSILDLFTYTKAQTAIEDGCAEKESLRFQRVVRQHSPVDGAPLVFYADCEIEESCEQKREGQLSFTDVCKAMRNIGMNRTRGLGAVECEYIPELSAGQQTDEEMRADSVKSKISHILISMPAEAGMGVGRKTMGPACEEEKEYCLRYNIFLDAPLMISNTSGGESVNYINGTSILGAAAASYLHKYGSPDGDFEELFLKDHLIFANAYIEGGIPAPHFLMKLKSSGAVGSVFTNVSNEPGKLLKNEFVTRKFVPVRPETETQYHHRRGEPGRRKALLYTQTCISAHQNFQSEITGKGKYIRLIEPLLTQGLRLGRSKTAEYAGCHITILSCEEQKIPQVTVSPGDTLVAALEADVLCLHESGYYTADSDDIFSEIKHVLDLPEDTEPIPEYTTVTSGTVTGYSSVWNAKKPHIRCVSAGSIFVFRWKDGCQAQSLPAYFYIGDKRNEGFGKCRLYQKRQIDQMDAGWCGEEKAQNTLLPASVKQPDTPLGQEDISGPESTLFHIISEQVAAAEQHEEMRQSAIAFYGRNQDIIKKELNAALVGRVLLMAEQSESLTDFKNRINGIRSREKRNRLGDLISAAESEKKHCKEYCEKHYKEYYKLVFTLAQYGIKQKEASDEQACLL